MSQVDFSIKSTNQKNSQKKILKQKNDPMSLEECVDEIVKNINFEMMFPVEILEKQKRTWLSFSRPIPDLVKKKVPGIVYKKTGKKVRWIKDGSLVIDFFSTEHIEKLVNQRSMETKKIEQKSIKTKEENKPVKQNSQEEYLKICKEVNTKSQKSTNRKRTQRKNFSKNKSSKKR